MASSIYWDFPYFTHSTEYPENSGSVKMGNGYTFTTAPIGPPQRTFRLKLEGMRWRIASNHTRDAFTNPHLNLARLENFYKNVQLWRSFWFPHWFDGYVLVRFARPLRIPEGIKGGNGLVPTIEIDLIEQPLRWPTPQVPQLVQVYADTSTITADVSGYMADEE